MQQELVTAAYLAVRRTVRRPSISSGGTAVVSCKRMVRAAEIELTARDIDRPGRPAKPLAFRRVALVTSLLIAVGCSSAETPEVAAAAVDDAFANTQDPKAKVDVAQTDSVAQTDRARGQAVVDAYMAEVEKEEGTTQVKAEGVAGE